MENWLEKLFIYYVPEGGIKKPFYKHVCYRPGTPYESLTMPIGIHLLAKAYMWLAYRWTTPHKRLKLITMGEWNKQYEKGYNSALKDMVNRQLRLRMFNK